MIDFIAGETKKIMYNCIKRYAEKERKDISEVQLVIGLNEEGNTYTICHQYKPILSLDIMEVLGVRIDFLGYSRLAPPFILKSLVRFAEVYKYAVENSKVMCISSVNEKNKPDVLLYLYNNNDYVATITFSDLFREEDFEMPV